MEEQLSSTAITHLLQYTLRSLCFHDNSQWVYAVFWRILPRSYPPPKWDREGAHDRSRGNRRNWILVWEDGFCNFGGATADINSGENSVGLQPEIFFKMSHEIYNYGEGLIGKVASDHTHKWIYKEPSNQEINFLSAWHNPADTHPRTWESQFQSGIKTIALIAVKEGVVQLGAVNKVIEDLSYVIMLRKKFSFIESIPGVLMPHPSISAYPFKMEGYGAQGCTQQINYAPQTELNYYSNHLLRVTPSMSSLEALLSRLPSVVPPRASGYGESTQPVKTVPISSAPARTDGNEEGDKRRAFM